MLPIKAQRFPCPLGKLTGPESGSHVHVILIADQKGVPKNLGRHARDHDVHEGNHLIFSLTHNLHILQSHAYRCLHPKANMCYCCMQNAKTPLDAVRNEAMHSVLYNSFLGCLLIL